MPVSKKLPLQLTLASLPHLCSRGGVHGRLDMHGLCMAGSWMQGSALTQEQQLFILPSHAPRLRYWSDVCIHRSVLEWMSLLRLLRATICRVCPNAIRIMGYIVRKLNAVPSTAPWLAVRLSYGMNGILLPMKNLPSLTSYMRWALSCGTPHKINPAS